MKRRFVLTGGPGAGKTAILDQLSKQGFRTASDVARDIIRERKLQGLTPRPDPQAFAEECHRRNVDAWEASQECEVIFYERCACDSIAGLLGSGLISSDRADQLMAQYRYDAPIFIPPPWEAIYTTDSERDHTFDHAVRVHEQTLRWYRRYDYQVCEVPVGPVEDRVNYVLSKM